MILGVLVGLSVVGSGLGQETGGGVPLTTTTINGQEYQIPSTGKAATYYIGPDGQLSDTAPVPQSHFVVSQEANKEFLQNCLGTCQGQGPECAQGCHAAARTITGMAGQEFRNIQQIQSSIAQAVGLRPAQEGTVEYIPAQPSNVPQPRQPWAQGGQPQWNGRGWSQPQPQPSAQAQFQPQSTFGGLIPNQPQAAAQQAPDGQLPAGTPHIKANIPKFGVPVLTMEDFNQRYGGARFAGGRQGFVTGSAPKFGQILGGGSQRGFGGGFGRFAQPSAPAFSGFPQRQLSQNGFGGGGGIFGLRGNFFKRRK